MNTAESQILELRITGEVNGQPLSPETASMEMIVALVNETKDFILGSVGSTAEREQFLREVHFEIKAGSVKPHITIPAFLTTSAIAMSLASDIKTLSSGSLDIDAGRSKVIQNMTKRLQRNEISAFAIEGTDLDGKPLNVVIDKNTRLTKPRPVLVNVEEYVKVEIKNMGGISPNVHLKFEDGSTVIASATEAYLKSLDKNYLYKEVIAHITYNQNPQTNQKSDYRLLGITEPPATFDWEAFDRAVEAGTKLWEDVPAPVAWVRETRGVYDA